MAARMTVSLVMALAALALGPGGGAAASEGPQQVTISTIEPAGPERSVYLEGAALAQLDGQTYLFSDGTGTLAIDLEAASPDAALPLFTLLGVEGTVRPEGLAVSEWQPLRVVIPAVVVPQEEVIDAFWEWIVRYGSQRQQEPASPSPAGG